MTYSALIVWSDTSGTNVCIIQSKIHKIKRFWSKSDKVDDEESVYRAKQVAKIVAKHVWSVKFLRDLSRLIIAGDDFGADIGAHLCEAMEKRKLLRQRTRQKVGMLIGMPQMKQK